MAISKTKKTGRPRFEINVEHLKQMGAQIKKDAYQSADSAAKVISFITKPVVPFFEKASGFLASIKELDAVYKFREAAVRDLVKKTGWTGWGAESERLLKKWKETQVGRLLIGLPKEPLDGFVWAEDMVRTLRDLWRPNNQIHTKKSADKNGPSTSVGFESSLSLFGPSELSDKAVWTIKYTKEPIKIFNFVRKPEYLRTHTIENWDMSANSGKPISGNDIQPVITSGSHKPFAVLSAEVTSSIVPIPTYIGESIWDVGGAGQPRILYRSISHPDATVVWDSSAGQLYLVLPKAVEGREIVALEAYHPSNDEILDNKLRPYKAQPTAAAPDREAQSFLSTSTRAVFEKVELLEDGKYGAYALTPFEKLQYAASVLKNSWTYAAAPEGIEKVQNSGKEGLALLHDPQGVTTANCGLANTEFAYAARAYGYSVRIVTGFLDDDALGAKALNAPGHQWMEVFLVGHWQTLDATPGFKTSDPVKSLPETLQEKLHMIAEYDRSPERRALPQQLAEIAASPSPENFTRLWNTMSALPSEEKAEPSADAEGNRYLTTSRYVLKTDTRDPKRLRTFVYQKDITQPRNLGALIGDFVSTTLLYEHHFSGYRNYRSLDDIYNGEKPSIVEWNIPNTPTADDDFQLKPVGTFAAPDEPVIQGKYTLPGRNTLELPGYPGQLFEICDSYGDNTKCILKTLGVSKDNSAVLVEKLPKLKFQKVQARLEFTEKEKNSPFTGDLDRTMTEAHRKMYFLFNPETKLLLGAGSLGGDKYNGDPFGGMDPIKDPHGNLWKFRITPGQDHAFAVLVRPKLSNGAVTGEVAETPTVRDERAKNGKFDSPLTNRPLQFATVIFRHLRSNIVEDGERRRLVTLALGGLLGQPPELSVDDIERIAVTSYISMEAIRLKVTPDEIAAAAEQTDTYGASQNCDILKDNITVRGLCIPPHLKPLISPDELLRDVIRVMSLPAEPKSPSFYQQYKQSIIDPDTRKWMDELIDKTFKKVPI